MSVKIKELKDDAIIDVKVNKNFYLMLKHAMFYIFQQQTDVAKKEELIKKVLSKDTKVEFTDHESAFRTLMIILAEIERVAIAEDKMVEREMPAPSPTPPTPES
jgi:hypothetical protein